jgi:hypothetical protein
MNNSDLILINCNSLCLDLAVELLRVKYKDNLWEYDEVNDINIMRAEYIEEYEKLIEDLKEFIITQHKVNE